MLQASWMPLNNLPIPSAILPEVQAAQPRFGYNTWKWSTFCAPSSRQNAQRTGSFIFKQSQYLAASGRNLYVKCSRLYLQSMSNLREDHPAVYRDIVSNFHVVRRSDRLWAGLSTDLVIEQVLMRSLKTSGGLTRGRGFTEQQRLIWLLSMSACA